MRRTITLAGALAVLFVVGCGDDDSTHAVDGGKDASTTKSGNGNGNAGGSGGAQAGKTGSGSGHDSGTTSGSGSGADEDAGHTMQHTASDSGIHKDSGTAAHGSTQDAGSSDAGDASHPATGCAGLTQCCAKLSAMDRMSCDVVTKNADDATCDQFQPILCAPAAADAGAASCTALDTCCQSLPLGQARVACATAAMSGVGADCQQFIGVFCPDGGNPDACSTLSTCCGTIKQPPQRANCNTVVQAGLPAACQTVQATLCP